MTVHMRNNRDDLAVTAYGMFRSGMDTSQVAKSMKLSEAQASRLVWIGRCWAKGKPATYEDSAGRRLQVAQTREDA